MRFSALALSLAALAAVILVAYADAPRPSLATSPPSAQRMSIDMDPAGTPANTATSLGSRETCASMIENNVLDGDEDLVDTVEFDVTITGIPVGYEMLGYGYDLNYPAPSTEVVSRQPMIINPPAGQSEPLPDTDGQYTIGVIDPSPPYASGNGVLDRIRIETTPVALSGVFPVSLSNAGHVDTNGIGRAPDAIDNAVIEVNTGGCSIPVDTEMVSMSLTSASPFAIGSYSTVTVDMTVRNNGPQSASTNAITIFNVPTSCTLNGAIGAVVAHTGLGTIAVGTSVVRQETGSLRCTSVGSFVMPVTACGQLDDQTAIDPMPGNNCMMQNLNFEVTGVPGSLPNAERFSIDMDAVNSPANTATSLGSREPCAAMSDDGVLNLDEDLVDTVEFDVTVTGIPVAYAAIGYAYTLSFPSPQAVITSQVPVKITGFGIPPDSTPDYISPFNVTGVDGDPPYESGSGTLDHIRIEALTSTPGMHPLSLSGAAHVDLGGTARAPNFIDDAWIALNSVCPTLVETGVVSVGLTSANPIPIGSNATVTADITVRNNGPQSGNTTVTTEFAVPSGCTLNNASGTVVLNAGLGVVPSGTSVVHQETPSLRCASSIGSFVMPVTACGQVDDPQALDLLSVNDCITQNLNFDVVAPPGTDADSDGVYDLDEFNCGVSSFGVGIFPERLNGLDDDGDSEIDEALPPGSEAYDCDGDGYVGTTEAHVFGAGQDQGRCGAGNWPADIATGGIPDSTGRVNIGDLVSFIVPTRHLNTNVGDNPGNVRWDLVPGKGVFPTDINVSDLTNLVVVRPPMYSGVRAWLWLPCTP